jgi:RHH-type rel operon transcriptional repressor/antitoxin RelB
MLAIRLPSDVEARLDALAKATGRTKTFYAREAILEHLDALEDLYLAEQRLIANRAGESATYSLDDVERVLGLED